MLAGRRSRTAEAAAFLRALHRHIDDPPLVFDDDAVEALLPAAARRLFRRLDRLGRATWRPSDWRRRSGAAQMRAQIVVRARYAEDLLHSARQRGAGQYLILAAGLDTYALRAMDRELPVFEVDHPATQQWKRSLLAHVPPQLHFMPVDFERESLHDVLTGSALSRDIPTFIAWLGTTYYLRESALRDTLTSLATVCATGSELVLDYWTYAPIADGRGTLLLAGARLATALQNEPLRTLLAPPVMQRLVTSTGWQIVEHCTPAQQDARYLMHRNDGLTLPSFAHLLHLRLQ
jgi:methyltransferase (TIGR00027 family)